MMKPTFADLLSGVADVLDSETTPEADDVFSRSQRKAATGILRRAAHCGSREVVCVMEDNTDMVATLQSIAAVLPLDQRPELEAIAERAARRQHERIDAMTLNVELQGLVVAAMSGLRRLLGPAHDDQAFVLLRGHFVRSLERHLLLEPPSLALVRRPDTVG